MFKFFKLIDKNKLKNNKNAKVDKVKINFKF